MFGTDDKKQTNDQQPQDNANPAAALADASLVTPPPDQVFAPTAPPLNDAMTPDAEAQSAPPPDMPTIANKPLQDDTASSEPSRPSVAANDDVLMNIKQQALHSLAPLVGQLDQTPEEKFKTTMMLIQASDNAALIKDAYDAANAITDEKARAQALLDVVNEINYFTQHEDQEQN